MGNTYTKIGIHYIFSTKYRKALILPEFEESLWACIAGIAKDYEMAPLAVGGASDHIHALLLLPTTITVAKGAQLIKGASSKWVNDQVFKNRNKKFRWQKGYGAFSVSESKISAVMKYINNQKVHHRKRSFQEEYLSFLAMHRINYDSRYVFG